MIALQGEFGLFFQFVRCSTYASWFSKNDSRTWVLEEKWEREREI